MTGYKLEMLYPLELTHARCTALMKLPATEAFSAKKLHSMLCQIAQQPQSTTKATISYSNDYQHWQGIEAFVLEGQCCVNNNIYQQGSYLRLPEFKQDTLEAVTDCIVFFKLNQFLPNDTGVRAIDTKDPDSWLPGPVDGIEIRPLHVFDTESIMLLRWHHAAEFRPKINPRGEEILVINGLLQNRDDLFRQYSWIRNPIEDWRKWHGNTATLAYYKSGHFPGVQADYTKKQ